MSTTTPGSDGWPYQVGSISRPFTCGGGASLKGLSCQVVFPLVFRFVVPARDARPSPKPWGFVLDVSVWDPWVVPSWQGRGLPALIVHGLFSESGRSRSFPGDCTSTHPFVHLLTLRPAAVPGRIRCRGTKMPHTHRRVPFQSSFARNLELFGRFTFPHRQGRIAAVAFDPISRRVPGCERLRLLNHGLTSCACTSPWAIPKLEALRWMMTMFAWTT